MSRSRRVGGSGWAGVYGSFIGLSKSAGGGKGGLQFNKASKKKSEPVKIDLASLPDTEEVQRAAKRVLAVHADLEKAKKRVGELEGQLVILSNKLKIDVNLAKPNSKKRRPRKSKTKASPQ